MNSLNIEITIIIHKKHKNTYSNIYVNIKVGKHATHINYIVINHN